MGSGSQKDHYKRLRRLEVADTAGTAGLGRPRHNLEMDKSRSGKWRYREMVKIRTAAPAQASLTATNRIAAKCLNNALCVSLMVELDEAA